MATHGFEQSELEIPRCRLKEAGADVHVISPERGHIRGWHLKDWGHPVTVDRLLDEVRADDYDVLVLPGGQINPDLLRVNQKALDLVRAFHRQKKTIAAVCHAPWLLIETELIKGHRATSYASIKTDMINAGAKWIDAEVVVDRGIITARNPGDLEAFSRKIIETLAEGRGKRSAA
jgi:protease I